MAFVVCDIWLVETPAEKTQYSRSSVTRVEAKLDQQKRCEHWIKGMAKVCIFTTSYHTISGDWGKKKKCPPHALKCSTDVPCGWQYIKVRVQDLKRRFLSISAYACHVNLGFLCFPCYFLLISELTTGYLVFLNVWRCACMVTCDGLPSGNIPSVIFR